MQNHDTIFAGSRHAAFLDKRDGVVQVEDQPNLFKGTGENVEKGIDRMVCL